jgi:hypothetical protein
VKTRYQSLLLRSNATCTATRRQQQEEAPPQPVVVSSIDDLFADADATVAQDISSSSDADVEVGLCTRLECSSPVACKRPVTRSLQASGFFNP